MSGLFCPKCDYNLTGLIENRCPECGTPFDPEKLREMLEAAPRPMSIPALAFYVLWPGVVFPALLWFLAFTGLEWFYGTWAVTVLVVTALNGMVWLDGFVAFLRARADASPYAKYPPGRSVALFVVLFFMQLLLIAPASLFALHLAY